MSEIKKNMTWDEVREYGAHKVIRTNEDWIEVARVVDSMDQTTIPAHIKFPDLRPNDVEAQKEKE
jgi:hypothetical protein